MIHDEAIKELFKEYNKADKKHYTDTFLSTMSSACWNSCLYVYATMKTFPLHSFKLLIDENHNLKPCPICSSFYEENMMGNIEEYFPIETNTNDIFERLFVLR